MALVKMESNTEILKWGCLRCGARAETNRAEIFEAIVSAHPECALPICPECLERENIQRGKDYERWAQFTCTACSLPFTVEKAAL